MTSTPEKLWSVTRAEHGTTRAVVEIKEMNQANEILLCQDIFDVANGHLDAVTRWDDGTTQTTKKGKFSEPDNHV